jgi:hypothetical protein
LLFRYRLRFIAEAFNRTGCQMRGFARSVLAALSRRGFADESLFDNAADSVGARRLISLRASPAVN